ncbi:hypothetical protein DLK05_17715 [Ancylomarina longa]|uniref:Transmembrane protein n=2 Tax=Ancylomarina longa TaxID=2487017 RepID=A0A434AE18_9BACT|nr:hypothetical protein DLK05_17715 [Ancylomarina longa]
MRGEEEEAKVRCNTHFIVILIIVVIIDGWMNDFNVLVSCEFLSVFISVIELQLFTLDGNEWFYVDNSKLQ